MLGIHEYLIKKNKVYYGYVGAMVILIGLYIFVLWNIHVAKPHKHEWI